MTNSKRQKVVRLSKQAAATFVEISLEDVEKLLKRSFHSTRPKRGQYGGIYYYDLKVGDNVAIRVWSSVSVRAEMGRDVGESAIRVHLVSLKTNRPLEAGKAPIVKRTQNWRTNLQDLIEEALEKFEDNEAYWESRAGGVAAPREVDDESPGEPRELDEIASWAKTSTGDWGVAVKDSKAKEGDKVRARTQGGDESTITLGRFDRTQYGKHIFYKGKQEGGRPQRSYDYRS